MAQNPHEERKVTTGLMLTLLLLASCAIYEAERPPSPSCFRAYPLPSGGRWRR